MARKAEFNRQEVLQKAMDVFWQDGYCKSSISGLVAATHLQPGSLYAAFNSKEGLFLATLENYSRQSIKKLQDCLDQADTPLEGVKTFIKKIGEDILSSKRQRGCFLVNTVLEIAPGKTLINQEVNKHLKAIESHLLSALVSAHKAGELSSKKKPEVLTKYLMVNIWGLRVLAKTNPDNKSVRAILAQILTCLED
ncbi:MAG: TetR/AcrR family transcriptional regulator [Deltaproteobacteria bacterium]|nr:TetR/AcrR family transcriptional regulator [Deltaproteobacteria bacterium]